MGSLEFIIDCIYLFVLFMMLHLERYAVGEVTSSKVRQSYWKWCCSS